MSLSRLALTSCAAVALLAACGGSQLPIGAPGAMPQSYALLTRAASGNDLIYVTSADFVSAYDFSGNLIFNLKNLYDVRGLCSDASGNVFIPDGGLVYEYAHGGTQPISVLTLPSGYHSAFGCAVDPSTGNLAVTSTESDSNGPGNVAIFKHAKGTPKVFADSDIYEYVYCGYDDKSNLFVDGITGGKTYLSELPSRGSALTTITLNKRVQRAGAVQWDGQYVSMADSYSHLVYQITVSGTTGTVVGTSYLDGWKKGHGIVQSWISNGTVLIPYYHHVNGIRIALGIWSYPDGGKVLSNFALHYCCVGGVTVSAAPHR